MAVICEYISLGSFWSISDESVVDMLFTEIMKLSRIRHSNQYK